MKLYVVGFAFSSDQSQVILIQKHKPSWQKGRLNGLGGKIEPGESSLQAMIREFNEEAGVHIPNWTEYATISKPRSHRIHFFKTFTDISQIKLKEILKVC